MRIILFDEAHLLKQEELKRLAELGIKEILTYDYWFEAEPERGVYNFDRLLKYQRFCHSFGIKLLIMGGQTPPLWAPKSWFLKNGAGVSNDFAEETAGELKEITRKIHSGETIEADQTFYRNERFFSYWHPEAEACLQNYIKKLQEIFPDSEHICNIGQWGEVFFPLTFVTFDQVLTAGKSRPPEEYSTPWYYDQFAEKSWRESGLSRDAWLRREFLRITRERLVLYPTKWLQYLPLSFWPERDPHLTGNVATEEALAEHRQGLQTIFFSVFATSYFPSIAAAQAKKYPVFAGSEGCIGLLPNYLRAQKLGLAGLICSPSTPAVYQPVQEWQYRVLRMALVMEKGSLGGLAVRGLGQILRVWSTLQIMSKERGRYLGLVGRYVRRRITRAKLVLGLSFQIAKAEFKLRNEGSYLGILWYLLNPILMFALLFFIFSDRIGTQIPQYPLYLLLGIIMFNFFQSSTSESTKSLIKENHYLIKSINFPRESLILALIFKDLFSHLFEVVLFVATLIFFHVPLVGMWYYLPLLFFFLLFVFGTSLILSSLTVFFVDLDNIWNFAVRLIWFGTPIFYAIENQTRLFYLNVANPLYYFITAARDLLIYQTMPENWITLGSIGFALVATMAGLLVFSLLDKKIAELV